MPWSDFNALVYDPKSAVLRVSGPIDPMGTRERKMFGQAIIRYLIIQDMKGESEAAVIHGYTEWQESQEQGTWEHKVPEVTKIIPGGLKPGPARAIGIGVFVKTAPEKPPAFETYTWCVPVTIEEGTVDKPDRV